MKRGNLVIVQPFAGNSRRLKGFIDFLKEYFNVYFIDLPGFIKTIPPLTRITLDDFSKYAEEKIRELNLKEYWASGISLGFEVLNNASLDKNCQGIIAIAPYVNSNSLNKEFKKKMQPIILIDNLICFLKIYNLVWKNRLFRKYIINLSELSLDEANKILDEIDPKTFFETVKLIFKIHKQATFHHLPCVLLINKHDEVVDYHYILRVFRNNPQKELVINDIQIPHVPKEVTKDYFKKNFPKEDLEKILKFTQQN